MADRRENAFPLRLLKKDPELEKLMLRYKKKKSAEENQTVAKKFSAETISVINKTELRRKGLTRIQSKDIGITSEFKLPTLG